MSKSFEDGLVFDPDSGFALVTIFSLKAKRGVGIASRGSFVPHNDPIMMGFP
jgi:hypothetical protein